jgi:hypothetical protein
VVLPIAGLTPKTAILMLILMWLKVITFCSKERIFLAWLLKTTLGWLSEIIIFLLAAESLETLGSARISLLTISLWVQVKD